LIFTGFLDIYYKTQYYSFFSSFVLFLQIQESKEKRKIKGAYSAHLWPYLPYADFRRTLSGSQTLEKPFLERQSP